MHLKNIGLVDTSFRHNPLNTVPGNDSQFIKWNRDDPFSEELVCFTNEKIVDDSRFRVEKYRRIALLYESRDTMQWLYKQSKACISDYALFFTHEKALLDSFSNARWIPGNGIWIGNPYGGGEVAVSHKDRLMSFVTSTKNTTPLQRFRVMLAEELQANQNFEVDVFLRSSNAFDYLPINICLQRYRYSLIIENTQSPLYFTEKLLNCFATGTIPIYFGANEIHKFFDLDGIIPFSSRKQLINEILPVLSSNLYDSKLEAIKVNFELSKNYESIEKVIASHLP